MTNSGSEEKQNRESYKVNIPVVTFIVILTVIVITLVYFIRIYSSTKDQVIKTMQKEAGTLERVITRHFNYSYYFIEIISRHIQHDPDNLESIQKTLQDHFISKDSNWLFGWRKYSWVDSSFHELVTSTRGIEPNPKYLSFVKEVAGQQVSSKNNISFYTKKAESHSLKLINNVIGRNDGKYLGSVILSYDIGTMTKNLNNRKKMSSTNFILIDDKLNVVTQSKQVIDNVINKEVFANHLSGILGNLNMAEQNFNDFYYLDMINGVNYFIHPIKGFPFAVVINIDNEFIRSHIIDNITKKFLEACVFAFICLSAIIAIYKRETELRGKAERAKEIANRATKAKTDFLAFTAHEIRSPLGFILTGSEMMTKELMGQMKPEYYKYAQGIHQSAKTMLDFITDILDENQILEGKFKIVNSLSDVTDIISDAIETNIITYSKRKVEIVTDFADNLPLVICDRKRIKQVISNLISNGIKYSEDNTTISIKTEIVDENLVVTIADQGFGMSSEEIPLALSTYGTVHKNKDKSISSYGLGLPIVKMLLDAHDARLVIDSIEGEGTTVKIIFPKYQLVYK